MTQHCHCASAWQIAHIFRVFCQDWHFQGEHGTMNLYTVRCHFNAINFLQNPRNSSPERARYGVCCEIKIWFTLCYCRRIVVWNIIINWAALYRHSTVLGYKETSVLIVITEEIFLKMTFILYPHLAYVINFLSPIELEIPLIQLQKTSNNPN